MSESAVQVLSFFAAEWFSDAITEVNWSFGDREGEKPNDDVPDSIDVFMSESAVQVLSDVADNDSEKSLDVATTVLLFKSGVPIMALSIVEQSWSSTSSFKNTDW